MLCPVIQKVIFSREVFVERRLPSARGGSEADGGKFFVKKGSQVRPFDFVAEVPEAPRNQSGQRLTAGVGGEVVKILPGKAILIKTSAVIVRGVVGKGEDDEGEIRIVAESGAPIALNAVDTACAGDILVGGFVPSLEVFKKAEAVGVKGIVCGGTDLAAFQKSTLPTLLTEGFGHPPLNHPAFEFLKKVEGRHVFLSPEREELLVARLGEDDRSEFLETSSEEVTEVFVEIKKGMEVQVFTEENFGQTGKVEKVLGDTVEVQLDKGDKIVEVGRNIGIIK